MALTKKAEKTRSRLLESARRLISERGFDHVSVEDITKDSGVAKGTFYHYFECKEEVVAALSFQCSVTWLRTPKSTRPSLIAANSAVPECAGIVEIRRSKSIRCTPW